MPTLVVGLVRMHSCICLPFLFTMLACCSMLFLSTNMFACQRRFAPVSLSVGQCIYEVCICPWLHENVCAGSDICAARPRGTEMRRAENPRREECSDKQPARLKHHETSLSLSLCAPGDHVLGVCPSHARRIRQSLD